MPPSIGRFTFETGLEQNRDKLVDAERKVGISPVKPLTADQLSSAFATNPELLATAENCDWLYTNLSPEAYRELRRVRRALWPNISKRRDRRRTAV